MEKQHLAAATALIAVFILVTAYLFHGAIIGGINERSRIAAAEHISDHRCGQSGPFCPGTLECYTGFNRERIGIDIQHPTQDRPGQRCVTPVFSARYCGLFERSSSSGTSSIPSVGNCVPITPTYVLKNPGILLELPQKLIPPPNGSKILATYNFSSVAVNPISATEPETFAPCDTSKISIYHGASYHPQNHSLTVSLRNTGRRDTSITVRAIYANTTIAQTSTPVLLRTGLDKNVTFAVNQAPDRVTIISQDCPRVRTSTTDIKRR